jgi:hypothetical protein
MKSTWLSLDGESLADVEERSPDAPYIVDYGDDPEKDEWFYAEVPTEMLTPTDNLLYDEDNRNPPIVEWVRRDHGGNWLEALRASPLLVLVDGISVYILDGWHRLKLARANGLRVIPVCYAFAPGE